MPVFDKEEAEQKFDDDNPIVEVPDDSEPDVNNDWILDEDEELAQITAFNAAKE